MSLIVDAGEWFTRLRIVGEQCGHGTIFVGFLVRRCNCLGLKVCNWNFWSAEDDECVTDV
jgi:hypothetical protein